MHYRLVTVTTAGRSSNCAWSKTKSMLTSRLLTLIHFSDGPSVLLMLSVEPVTTKLCSITINVLMPWCLLFHILAIRGLNIPVEHELK